MLLLLFKFPKGRLDNHKSQSLVKETHKRAIQTKALLCESMLWFIPETSQKNLQAKKSTVNPRLVATTENGSWLPILIILGHVKIPSLLIVQFPFLVVETPKEEQLDTKTLAKSPGGNLNDSPDSRRFPGCSVFVILLETKLGFCSGGEQRCCKGYDISRIPHWS